MDAAPDVADPILVNDVLQQLKSEGTFDQFRRDCLGDVDTKPAYQNLRQRVENYVSNFLSGVTWSPTMNKNQLRDSLRRQINQSEILAIGVERVIEQVVDPQIQHVFRPKLEEVVQNILKVELDPNSEMGLSGFIPTTCSSNPSQLFSNQVSVNESQPSYVNQATSFTGHVSVSTTPVMESPSSVAPPLPYEAPPLPSHSPPPLPEEAPPPPLPESVAPPPPPDEPPSPSQDMDVDSTESIDIEETSISEPPQKSGPFKFMKNLLHKAKEKVKGIIGEKEEESKHDDENMTVESNVVEEKMQILELEETDDKNEGCLGAKDGDAGKGDGGGDDEEDRLTDITVSSVHTSDLSSFTEGISSSSSSDLSDSDDDELKKISDSVEMPGERSLSRCSSLATDSDKGSSKGSGRKSSNLALAISRYHSDSDEDMEKRQERRRKAAEAREERAVLRQQAREEHQKKIEQMKAERLAKKRKKALQEKSNTSDEEDTDDRPGRKEKRTRSIQLKEQMKEKLLEKKKEKKRMAAASHSAFEETLSPRKQVTDSKPIEIYRLDLVARQLKKPLVKTHYLLCEELPGEEQMNDSNKKEKFRESDGNLTSAENQENIEDKLEEGELKEAVDDELHRLSDASNVEINESVADFKIIDGDDKNEKVQSVDVKTKHFSIHESQKSCDVAVESSSLKDKSQEHDGMTIADSSLKTEPQKQDYVPVAHSSLKVNSKMNSDVALTSAEISLKDESEDESDRSMTVRSQKDSDVAVIDISLKDKSHKNSDVAVTDESQEKDAAVTTSSVTGESHRNCDVTVTDSNLKDKSYKNIDVAVTDRRLQGESLEGDDISMTYSSVKDQSKRDTVISCETNNIAVSDSFLHGDSQRNKNIEVTERSSEVESQKRNDVAVTDSKLENIEVTATDSNLKGESQKTDDVAVNDGNVKDALVVQTQTCTSSKNILLEKMNTHESFKTNKGVMMENNLDSEKKEQMNVPPRSKDKVGDDHCEVEKEKSITKDHASPDNVFQESEKDDNSEENPPTPTQDEPSTLEEIAEDEPAAIPIYSVSPAAYQGPTIGSLFKIGMGDADRSAEQANSNASSPLSAISSGDLSGGEEEKILEDEEPDEEGEIKDSTESVTQEKPNSDGGSRDDKEEVHEGRYGMRSRRKINSPKYSGDEYLWYGFKKRSSGSIEEKGNKETKAGSRTRTTDTERSTRKSLRTDSPSAAKEEGEVYEQQETKKRQKGPTENSASIMPGRRQRQVPRRYSPSESVTGRRGQSPTQRDLQTRQSSNRYTEQQPFGERRTRRQQSPIQRETGRSRRGTTPPRRGLRRPSGDRASDSYPPSKRRR